ncbi:hypothetical protein ACWDZ8_09940 [Streptomyces sp. NPDC003233]
MTTRSSDRPTDGDDPVVVTGFKATRARKLTPAEKEANRVLAAGRAPVERGFAHLKNRRILTELRTEPARAIHSGFTSQTAIRCFIQHVNRHRSVTGLAEIPSSKVTPHMFRRTMAMLTRDYPGSEIAVGVQPKHAATRALANRWTQGYMDHDPSWARLLTTAIAERRFQRLRDLFDADSRGEAIGFGPGADQMRSAFAAVREKAGSPPSERKGPARGRSRRTRPAQAHAPVDPVRKAQPLHHGREQPRRREVPGRCHRAPGTPRATHRPLPARTLQQQHHRPRTPIDLEGRARFAEPAP